MVFIMIFCSTSEILKRNNLLPVLESNFIYIYIYIYIYIKVSVMEIAFLKKLLGK